jgi:hypothetical protein
MKFATIKTLVTAPNQEHPHALLDTSALPANIKAEVLATISKARRNPESLNTALKITDEARGRDLFQKCLTELQNQHGKWAGFVLQMRDINVGGRAEFLTLLRAHVKDMNAHVAAMDGTQEYLRWKKAKATAGTMLSALKVCARGLDAGYALETYTDKAKNEYCAQPFSTIVADCRLLTEAEASKAGRPADPAIVKVCKAARVAKALDDDDAGELGMLVAYLSAQHPEAWAASAPKKDAK